MEPRPIFYPSFGNRPDRLVGRLDVIERIERGLKSYPGGQDRAILLTGQRGMGKTALLLEVADRAAELGYVVARTTCGETMLDDIIDLLQRNGARYVKERKAPIKGFSAGALGFSVGLTFTEQAQRDFGFRVKLDMICDRLASEGLGVLLLVDEVVPSSAEMRSLATAYQEIAGDEKNIAIVMAGLPSAVSDVLNYKTLTFLNRASRMELGPISIPEVGAYYATAFRRAGRSVPDKLVDDAAEATEGFPYHLQLLGYYLVQYSEKDTLVTPDQLRRAEESARRDMDEKVYRAMLNPLSDLDVEFLAVMARHGGASKVADVGRSLSMAHGTAQTYRRRLLDAGVVVSRRRGELEFVVPQLGDYLRRLGEEN